MSNKSRDDKILKELQRIGRSDLIRAYRAGCYDEVLEELQRMEALLRAYEVLSSSYVQEAERIRDEMIHGK